jgi:hypothetical protein
MPMDEKAFRAQFKKPPADVIKLFRNKGIRSPKEHWDWSDTLRHAHDRAFVVAKATSLDLLKDIKGSINEALEKGQSLGSWKMGLIPKLQERGWWGKQEVVNPQSGESQLAQLGSPRRLKVIYETNIRTAYAVGNYGRMMDVADRMPYWTYTLGRVLTKHRAEHQAMEGLTFRYDDPFWQTHRPPQGFGCKCGVRNGDAADVVRRSGKPLDQAVSASKPEDFQARTVEVQGKQVSVVGYRVPGSSQWVYPQPGWDYSPGEFSWRNKQLLADKLVELPEGSVRQAFQKHMDTAIAEDFAQYIDVVHLTGVTRKEVLAIGVLDQSMAEALATKTFQFSSKARLQALDLSTPLLLVTDRSLLHAVREAKVAAGIAMPLDLLRKLPQLLKEYTLRWDPKGGLLAFSPEFKEGANLRRWKIVFTPWNAATEKHGPQRIQLRFKTVTKVGEDAIGLAKELL